MFDPLPADLAAAVEGAEPRLAAFGRLRFVAETDSTNDLALALAEAGEPEGTAVMADTQRRGRGRRGRDWFSPAGAGVYLSIVLRPRERGLSLVTIAAGVALARAVRTVAALPVELKWPNDLVIGRPWRKLAGVLSESAAVGSRVDAIVVGIGVNLSPAAYPREIAGRATSIETELGRSIDRAQLVAELLAEMRDVATRLHASDGHAICAEWRTFGRAGLAGAAVRWEDRGLERRGRAKDIDQDGALLVDIDGTVDRIIAGEVTWESVGRE